MECHLAKLQVTMNENSDTLPDDATVEIVDISNEQSTKKKKKTKPEDDRIGKSDTPDLQMPEMLELLQQMQIQQSSMKTNKKKKRQIVEDEDSDAYENSTDARKSSNQRRESDESNNEDDSENENDEDSENSENEEEDDDFDEDSFPLSGANGTRANDNESDDEIDLADVADNVIESLEGLFRVEDANIAEVLAEGVSELKKLNKNVSKLVKLFAVSIQS